MNEKFFVRREGKIEGPFEESFIIGVIKQGKLKPTDELASNQNGPWEVAESHPVFISGKPKKKRALPISEYKVLTRKASEGIYEIRYWCPKCTATVTLEEEESLGDYRCPACGVPSSIIGTAFEEIAADRNERKREADEREIRLLEEQRLAEERRLAKKGWGRVRRYAVNFFFSLGGLCVGVGTTALYMQTWPFAQEPAQPKNNSGLADTHQPEKGSADNPRRIRTEERREYQTATPDGPMRGESIEQFFDRKQKEGYEAAKALNDTRLMDAFGAGRRIREQSGYLPGETDEEFFERQQRQGERIWRELRE